MPDLKERIIKLAEYDSVSAQLLSDALEHDNAAALPAGDYASERDTISSWLAELDSPPNITILPAPASISQVRAFLDLLPDSSHLFLMEKQPHNLLSLFKELPLEQLVSEKRIRLAAGDNEEVIDYQLITILDLPSCPAVGIFTDNIESSGYAGFYKTMLLQIRDRISMKVFNLATITNLGPTWQYNTLKNLTTICKNPGVNSLHGIFKNKPAIVVAAGPSLNDAMPYLQKTAASFVVIAVGTALKPLLKNNIIPDLVVTVDASHKVAQQFDVPCEDLCVVSSSIINPGLMSKFKRIFTGYINANSVGKWISSKLDDKGMIMAGGTVTATAIDLAAKMECYPILTVGLDLCMANDGTSHAQNTMYHGHTYNKSNLIPVRGNYTPRVFTTAQFRTYIEAVADLVTHYPSLLFINTSTGGAKIEGMELDLPEHIKRYASPTPVKARDHIINIYDNAAVSTDTSGIITEISLWRDAISKIRASAEEAAGISNSLIVIMKNPALSGTEEIVQKLERLKDIDADILSNEYSNIMEMSLRPVFYDTGAELSITSNLNNNSIESIKRSRTLFQQIAGAAKWTGDLLENTISQLTFNLNSEQNENKMLMSA